MHLTSLAILKPDSRVSIPVALREPAGPKLSGQVIAYIGTPHFEQERYGGYRPRIGQCGSRPDLYPHCPLERRRLCCPAPHDGVAQVSLARCGSCRAPGLRPAECNESAGTESASKSRGRPGWMALRSGFRESLQLVFAFTTPVGSTASTWPDPISIATGPDSGQPRLHESIEFLLSRMGLRKSDWQVNTI